MRTLRRAPVLALLLAALVVLVGAAPSPTPTPDHHDRKPGDVFRLQPLSGGVYALYGRGGNIGFFVGADAVVVVDSEFKDIAPGILAQIRSVTDKPIKYLINTHHHGDHTGGNEAFQSFAVIIAHDSVRQPDARVAAADPRRIPEGARGGEEGRQRGGHPVPRGRDRVGEEGQGRGDRGAGRHLRLGASHSRGGETIEVWHTPPAHTDGDSVVYFTKATWSTWGSLLPRHDPVHRRQLRRLGARIPRRDRQGPRARAAERHRDSGPRGGVGPRGAEGRAAVHRRPARGRARGKAAGRTKEQFLAAVDLPAYRSFDGYKDRFKGAAAIAWDEAIVR